MPLTANAPPIATAIPTATAASKVIMTILPGQEKRPIAGPVTVAGYRAVEGTVTRSSCFVTLCERVSRDLVHDQARTGGDNRAARQAGRHAGAPVHDHAVHDHEPHPSRRERTGQRPGSL